MPSFILPRSDALIQTHGDDPLPYYYRRLTRWFYRKRLSLVLSHLEDREKTYGDLLDIGFGSGILVPEECRRARRVSGIDVHERIDIVCRNLAAQGFLADLCRGSIYEIPFPDASQDAVVCVSVLEHLDRLDAALAEVDWVLRPGGVLAVGFPVKSRLTGVLFSALGFDMDHIHPSSHTEILEALHRRFEVSPIRRLPGLFVTARCVKRWRDP